ncbi:hypothetical protein PTTG_12010 [Puccinia triticina 1-1 BBBD Race 1]|uniref:Uncharacterized protein n=1 Tax=Puccinia triticina (isolate 1-1 / race 1 (BBBD)) TaxID=630390 RepID=A0A180GZW4_PUCT1|nr:hypothetical protein PTTG_12010 [Puccinia triticina 1-1 BBBD Race 1]
MSSFDWVIFNRFVLMYMIYNLLVTDEVTKNIKEGLKNCDIGVAHFFIQHTSAALSINENYDSDVRKDMDMALDHIVPESLKWRHTDEGPDDSVSHTKASLIGSSISVPVTKANFCFKKEASNDSREFGNNSQKLVDVKRTPCRQSQNHCGTKIGSRSPNSNLRNGSRTWPMFTSQQGLYNLDEQRRFLQVIEVKLNDEKESLV